jgi:hypothetical protein
MFPKSTVTKLLILPTKLPPDFFSSGFLTPSLAGLGGCLLAVDLILEELACTVAESPPEREDSPFPDEAVSAVLLASDGAAGGGGPSSAGVSLAVSFAAVVSAFMRIRKLQTVSSNQLRPLRTYLCAKTSCVMIASTRTKDRVCELF